MRSIRVLVGMAHVLLIAGFLAWPTDALAQEATVTGTVTDSSGAMLPGVVIKAVHTASGNSFETVTDERGSFRVPVRTGIYRVTAELSGFATAGRDELELRVGQQVVVNLQMSPAGVEESIRVTAEAPLVDVSQSRVAGVVNPEQMQELPVNGRNYLDMTMLAPGSRVNSVTDVPASGFGNFQLNVDGQQVTQSISGNGRGNPGYSKDAIAEFEFIANRFDAVQGRSAGVQVNVVTKSGTNVPQGSLSGYFRDDSFNAQDFIQKRVLPFSDQQISTTYGGPIRKDRIHVFGNYEYERQPQTFTYTTPYAFLNIDQFYPRREDKESVRVDFQLSPRNHLTTRASKWDFRYFEPAGDNITRGTYSSQHSSQVFGSLSQVLGAKALNEIKGGYDGYLNDPIVQSDLASVSVLPGFNVVEGITLTGLTIGQTGVIPARPIERSYSIREDLTYSVEKGGRHTLRTGGDYRHRGVVSFSCRTCMGILDAQGRGIPANLADIIPNALDARTWNLNLLSPLVRTYTIGIGNMKADANSHIFGGWLQDDWTVTPRLTLNMGLRYDVATNLFGNATALPPFLEGNRPNDTNNWGPRFGSAFSLNDKTVIRGGFGNYYGATAATTSWFTTFAGQVAMIQVVNDGRPDFASNPFNGPRPTFEETVARLNAAGTKASYNGISSPDQQLPYSWQGSIGVQRELTSTSSLNVDYTFTGTRHDIFSRNINLNYNPATGANYSFQDTAHLPYPTFGTVTENISEGWSNYHGMTVVFTKRLSKRWQASGNYLLSAARDGTPPPTTAFPVAPDLGGEYGLSVGDQRHRAVANGIWEMGHGFQFSGLYFYGSGLRYATTWGGDLRSTGAAGSARLRPDGTIVPRNDFVGAALHRVDVRLQRRFAIRKVRVDGLIELFNLLNHANYGAYSTAQSLATTYGKPAANTNVAYTPRAVQLGFRVIF